MSERQLITILSDGEFHSGEALGLALGISRTAVWKQIKKVEALGLKLESIKGRGYCLPGGLNLLNKDAVLSAMSVQARALLPCLDIEDVIGSTNEQAMARAQQLGGMAYACAAEQQTGGKGRRGRPWFSPYARNLYFSVTWEFAGGAAALEGLSLAVGVVVSDVLADYGLDKTQLKWPNDILYEQKKLAGILLEMTGDAAGPCQVVVGIGLNVGMSAIPVDKAAIDQPWIDVEAVLGRKVDRNQLLGALLDGVIDLLASYEQQGWPHYRQRFMARDAYMGKPVYVKLGDRVVLGDCAGIDEAGALLLDTQAGREVFNGGEVSLRGVNAAGV
ncbi:bifunctional biotin--[acetyl-CoA-carboxylase] ligase/biotin operon repressor BirA [Dasania sp. GY-19]|uniref:Bifunctional ligase/repressor BirA n=1 Tax=Dasania phycosphaerae TaxID=2950436 RepID=A0A9J6RS44_9GAMM|nr:bifunctional biotin--[acetyl-CoA-carboxylase] ligase/biotin operon repressor BirA [Dasania phycosphaerae]MCZ0866992.1 bifunctional biotin--[acetyl-CoA-carboxylase] ligase/biotin operon repressor BirA [Dasania phycosphaerae]